MCIARTPRTSPLSSRTTHSVAHTTIDPNSAAPARRLATSSSLVIAFVMSSFAAGCHTVEPARPALSVHAVRLELPLERQTGPDDCGVATLVALCRHWGVEIDDAARASYAEHATANGGPSGAEMCAALRERELEAFLYCGALDRSSLGLYPQIDAGRPVVVMLQRLDATRHYVLVIGYDEPSANLIVLDSQRGEILVPVVLFERDWSACAYFTLLAVPFDAATLEHLQRATVSTTSTTSP